MINISFKSVRRFAARIGGESGSALVELALSVPLLSTLLLGAVEFGRVTYAGIEVSNAARAAVQYAATNGGSSADTGGIQNAAQNDSGNLGSSVTATVYSDTCVCSGSESTAHTCGTACPSGQFIMETITIQTSATFSPLVSIPGIKGPFTLNGYAKQMVLPQ